MQIRKFKVPKISLTAASGLEVLGVGSCQRACWDCAIEYCRGAEVCLLRLLRVVR